MNLPPHHSPPDNQRRKLEARAVLCVDIAGVLAVVVIFYILNLQWRGIDAGWITSYAADAVGTAWCWWQLRRVAFLRVRRGDLITVVLVLTAGVAWEWCQRYDLSGTWLEDTAGTFDPIDILVYALTLVACYALDVSLQRNAASAWTSGRRANPMPETEPS